MQLENISIAEQIKLITGVDEKHLPQLKSMNVYRRDYDNEMLIRDVILAAEDIRIMAEKGDNDAQLAAGFLAAIGISSEEPVHEKKLADGEGFYATDEFLREKDPWNYAERFPKEQYVRENDDRVVRCANREEVVDGRVLYIVEEDMFLCVTMSQNLLETCYWYQKAALDGCPRGMLLYGDCCYYGDGRLKDKDEAVTWYKKASAAGDVSAMNRLGQMYGTIQMSDEDKDLCDKALRAAAKANNRDAICHLARVYQSLYNDDGMYLEKCVRLFQKAADLGSGFAMFEVGEMYYYGFMKGGIDYKKAAEWYSKAAELEDSWGQTSLGICYHMGEGVPQSYDEAYQLYSRAAEHFNPDAMFRLGYMYEEGLFVKKDPKTAEFYYKMCIEYAGDRDWVYRTARTSLARLKILEIENSSDNMEFDLSDKEKCNEIFRLLMESLHAKVGPDGDTCFYLSLCFMFGIGTGKDLMKARQAVINAAEYYSDADYELFGEPDTFDLSQMDQGIVKRLHEKWNIKWHKSILWLGLIDFRFYRDHRPILQTTERKIPEAWDEETDQAVNGKGIPAEQAVGTEGIPISAGLIHHGERVTYTKWFHMDL